MGVRGLSTFIEKQEGLLIDGKLKNTEVVIDGNNLYHFLYHYSKTEHKYGGDYDLFSRECKIILSLLIKSGVKPIVVFDGGYSGDDRKLPTIRSRKEEKLKRVESVCETGQGIITPILAVETFRLVLVELNIPHVACDFEADDDIVVLANELNCPVMSDDSDFYVYDLKGGYIPLKYINLTFCGHDTETAAESTCTKGKIPEFPKIPKGTEYLPVKFYHRTRLSDLFTNKCPFIIPLFATLLGNDYLKTEALDKVHAKLKINRCYRRPESLIQWLNENEFTTLDMFANKWNIEEDMIKEIQRCIESYMTTGKYTSFSLKDFLSNRNKEKNMPSESRQPSVITDYFEHDLPSWFVEKLRRCEIHVQNAIVLHKVFLPCQVEKISNQSTYQCSREVREKTYGILFQPDAHEENVDNCVLEFDRDQKNIKGIYVAPAPVAVDSPLRSLSELPNVCLEERQLYFLSALGLLKEDFESLKMRFDDDFVLLIALMSYWIKHSIPKVSSAHLDSLILEVIILGMKWTEERNKIEETDPVPCSPYTLDCREPESCKQLSQAYKHIIEKLHQNSESTYDFNIVHGFAQFQACLLDVINLNNLLLCPFTQINPAFILNCSLLHELCSKISNRELLLSELLGSGSQLCERFGAVKTEVLKFCDRDCFTESKQKLSVQNDNVEEESVSEFSVPNRYSLLSSDD